jgi:hypothetical protein
MPSFHLELPDVGTLASVATALTLFVAVVFGIFQMRIESQRRRDAAAMSLLQSFQEMQLADALRVVLSLSDAASPAEVAAEAERVRAAEAVNYVMESWGIGVFERVIDLHTLDRACGGIVRACWRKLAPYVVSRRKQYGDNWGEWFQWLVERMAEDPAPGKALGAHVAFRNWRA